MSELRYCSTSGTFFHQGHLVRCRFFTASRPLCLHHVSPDWLGCERATTTRPEELQVLFQHHAGFAIARRDFHTPWHSHRAPQCIQRAMLTTNTREASTTPPLSSQRILRRQIPIPPRTSILRQLTVLLAQEIDFPRLSSRNGLQMSARTS